MLPDQFLATATRLLVLDLSHNGITMIPDQFLANATSLSKLYLHNNAITTIQDQFLANSTNLSVLNLHNKNKCHGADTNCICAPRRLHRQRGIFQQHQINATKINVTVFAQVAFVCRDACTNTRTFSSVTGIRQTE